MLIGPLPNKLRIKDGELFMADGTDLAAYLAEWAKRQNVSEDEPLTLTVRSDVELLMRLAMFNVVA